MDFELLSDITHVQVIAVGRSIRELARLRRMYGPGRWRKLKGRAVVRVLSTGEIRYEEVHWYEAHGIGKRECKIKYRPG
jgi:hypothetical protein